MRFKKCECGGKPEIKEEQAAGPFYSIRAICPKCGKRTRELITKDPQNDKAALYWAHMYWNYEIYEQEEIEQ